MFHSVWIIFVLVNILIVRFDFVFGDIGLIILFCRWVFLSQLQQVFNDTFSSFIRTGWTSLESAATIPLYSVDDHSVFYPPVFYVVLMYLYNCSVYFDQSEGWCAYPCYIDNNVLYNLDTMISTIFPVFVIVLANITLFIRVIRSMKRIRLEQNRIWKR